MKKRIAIIGLIFLFNLFFINISNATNLKANVNNNKIKSGEEIKIEVLVKDIDIKQGINALQGKLEYNKNDFESVKQEKITAKNNWSIAYNDDKKSDGNFVLMKLDKGEINEQELFDITLKAKNKIVGSKTQIKLIDLYTTDGEKMIPINDLTIDVEIENNLGFLIIGIIIAIIIMFTIIYVIVRKRKKVNK